MNGLMLQSELDHSLDTNSTLFDDWTFSSYNYWNDYFYSTNRTQLYRTAKYEIGKDKIVEIILQARPEKRVEKNTNVT